MFKLLSFLPAFLRKRLLVAHGLATRSMTLGVRAMALDKDDRVFLVRHTYVEGWHLPGGGVERNETFQMALEKELLEEANIEMTGPPRMFHVYKNTNTSRFDHVAVFVVRQFRQTAPKTGDSEIAEGRFFELDALPESITDQTKQRILEVTQNAERRDFW